MFRTLFEKKIKIDLLTTRGYLVFSNQNQGRAHHYKYFIYALFLIDRLHDFGDHKVDLINEALSYIGSTKTLTADEKTTWKNEINKINDSKNIEDYIGIFFKRWLGDSIVRYNLVKNVTTTEFFDCSSTLGLLLYTISLAKGCSSANGIFSDKYTIPEFNLFVDADKRASTASILTSVFCNAYTYNRFKYIDTISSKYDRAPNPASRKQIESFDTARKTSAYQLIEEVAVGEKRSMAEEHSLSQLVNIAKKRTYQSSIYESVVNTTFILTFGSEVIMNFKLKNRTDGGVEAKIITIFDEIFTENNNVLDSANASKADLNKQQDIQKLWFKTIGDFSQIMTATDFSEKTFHTRTAASINIFYTFDRVCGYISSLFNYYTMLENAGRDLLSPVDIFIPKNLFITSSDCAAMQSLMDINQSSRFGIPGCQGQIKDIDILTSELITMCTLLNIKASKNPFSMSNNICRQLFLTENKT